jgi:S1-C subfamily serine protease
MTETPLALFSEALADAVDRVAASVVQVHARRRPASGIVFGPDLVLTTARALGRDDQIVVRGGDGHALSAELGGWDPATSLVLLRVPGLDAQAPAVSERPVRVGQIALAVARSWSNVVTATSGVVAVIGGPLPTGHGRTIDRVIRTTAPMHSGFAGGAFVDVTGAVTGVTTAASIRGLAVVIPADIAWATAASLAEHGSLKRGYLGLAGQAVRIPDRQRGSAEEATALLVVGVVPGSPADEAGVLVGDVMVALDDRPVASPVDLLELLTGDRIGKTVSLKTIRGGVAQTLEVLVGERPVQG